MTPYLFQAGEGRENHFVFIYLLQGQPRVAKEGKSKQNTKSTSNLSGQGKASPIKAQLPTQGEGIDTLNKPGVKTLFADSSQHSISNT